MDQSNRCDPRGQRRRTFLPLLPVLLLTSCAAAPFLIPAGIEFARNLLFTSNKNYGSKYSEDMNRLLLRLSTPYVAMGLPPGSSPAALMPPAMLQQQQQQQQQMMAGQMQGQPMVPGQPGMYGGYDPYNSGGAAIPGTGYPQTGYGQQQPYAQQGNPYGTMPGNQAQPGGYYDPNNPYGGPNVSIQAPAYQGMNPYGGQYGGAAMGVSGSTGIWDAGTAGIPRSARVSTSATRVSGTCTWKYHAGKHAGLSAAADAGLSPTIRAGIPAWCDAAGVWLSRPTTSECRSGISRRHVSRWRLSSIRSVSKRVCLA